MLRLIANICHDGTCIGLADGKCAVARLPMELRELRGLGLNPFGGTGFYHLYHVRDRVIAALQAAGVCGYRTQPVGLG